MQDAEYGMYIHEPAEEFTSIIPAPEQLSDFEQEDEPITSIPTHTVQVRIDRRDPGQNHDPSRNTASNRDFNLRSRALLAPKNSPQNSNLGYFLKGFVIAAKLRISAGAETSDRDLAIYRQATTRQDAHLWQEAMQKEFNSLSENGTWTLQKAPADRRVLQGRWVYKKKPAGPQNPVKYKARWVVKGYEQEAGIDYNETFASVINRTSVKCLLALIAHFG